MKRRIFATLLAFCLIASLCVVGAAAALMYGMMNRQTKKKIGNMVSQASNAVADKANEMFGR